MLTLLFLYTGSGILLVLLSVPMILRKVKPNYLYGVRIAKTLNNPKLWYETNEYAGRYLMAAGVAILLAALGFYFIPGISLDTYSMACLAVFLVAALVGTVQVARFLKAR